MVLEWLRASNFHCDVLCFQPAPLQNRMKFLPNIFQNCSTTKGVGAIAIIEQAAALPNGLLVRVTNQSESESESGQINQNPN